MKSKYCFLFLVFILVCTAIFAGTPKKLFVLLGQSNIAGRAPIELEDEAPLPKVQLLNDQGFFEEARNPLNRYSNIRKTLSLQKLGLGYAFGRELADRMQDTIFIIVNARGGTPIEHFMKGDSTGYYEKTMFRIKQALKRYPDLRLEAIIWHQGESNRDNYKEYILRLATLIEDYRNDLDAPYLPLIAGELGKWNPEFVHISDKMALIPDSIPNAFLVTTQELDHIDDFHFDSESQRILGKRYAEKYLEINTKSTRK